MTSYAPVAVTGDAIQGPQQHHRPLEGDRFNGNGGVRREWWWQAGPVDSCCCCCSLRTGVGLLAADDFRSGVWILFFSRDFYVSALEASLAMLQDQYADECKEYAASTRHCEEIHRLIEQAEGAIHVLLHRPVAEDVLGVFCFVAGAVGLWAVFRRSKRAAKVYVLTWPTKCLLGAWTTLGYCSARKEYGVEQGAGSIGVQWLINIFVLLYYFKVAWSYYKQGSSSFSSASADTTHQTKPMLAMTDNL